MRIGEVDYYDNTQISTFRQCPRKFYLRHILDWRPQGISLPLSFGLSWHEGMDMVWGMANKETFTKLQVHDGAMSAFLECWTNDGLPDFMDMTPAKEQQMAPRTPGTAAEMFHHYIEQRWNWLQEIEVVEIEKPFSVQLIPNFPNLRYIGRLDKVFKKGERYFIGEHKTSSAYAKATGFRTAYVESYTPNTQVDGYNHALHMLYGDKAKAVWVDAALVHKTIHNVFKFIPIERSTSMLTGWLGETLNWIDAITREEEKLESQMDNDVLTAFPKNTNACWDYSQQCVYRDVCRFWPDPHHREVPEGMVVEKWNPVKTLGVDT